MSEYRSSNHRNRVVYNDRHSRSVTTNPHKKHHRNNYYDDHYCNSDSSSHSSHSNYRSHSSHSSHSSSSDYGFKYPRRRRCKDDHRHSEYGRYDEYGRSCYNDVDDYGYEKICYVRPNREWPPVEDNDDFGEDREFRNITANNIDTRTLSARPRTIYVPDEASGINNLGDALCSLKEIGEPLGYRIILRNGTHTLATTINNDVSSVRIEAESFTPHMGMYYGHGVGQHEFAQLFNSEYEDEIGGLGPWTITVSPNGKIITVNGDLRNPNYDMLEIGDVIRFYQRGADVFTDHSICRGCENRIFLNEPVCLDSPDNMLLTGEGFTVLPRARVEVVGHQKVIIQDRMEWLGVHIKQPELEHPKPLYDPCKPCKPKKKKCVIKGHFVSGATCGHLRVEHSHIESNLYGIGEYEMYKPNTWQGQWVSPGGVAGRSFYQSVVGSKGTASFNAGPFSTWEASSFIGAERGLLLVNGAKVSAAFGVFVGCSVGAFLESASNMAFGGTMFLENVVGLTGRSSCHASSAPVPGFDDSMFTPTFQNNTGTAVVLDFNTHTLINDGVFINNKVDVNLDGVNKMLPGDLPSGEIGPRLSTFIYDGTIITS